jgi:cell shape-determining protein MreC
LGQRLERVATSVAYTKALLSHLKSEEKRLRKALRQQLRGSDYDKVVARLFGLVFRGTQ